MNTQDRDELAGRIDALALALLELTAALEQQQVMDGPRVSQAWRKARPEHLAVNLQLQVSRQMLHEMAARLDDARQWRQAQAAQIENQ